MPIPLVLLNLLLFLGLAVYALSVSKAATSGSIRTLWRLAVLPAAAVILGGFQRLAIQASRAGWLPYELDFFLEEWQIAQSVVVAIIGIYTFLGMRRLASRFLDVETVVGDMVDRVKNAALHDLNLTRREQEVLNVIGTSTQIDDRTLAEKLGVSADTAHTHVSNLLRKTKLRDRRDLIVVAFLLRAHGDH